MTSQLIWEPIVIQYAFNMNVMRKPGTTNTHAEEGLHLCIFIDFGLFNEEEEVVVIFRVL